MSNDTNNVDIRNSWTLDASARHCPLDAGHCTMDACLWMLDPERWTLDTRPWLLDSEPWTLDSGRWTCTFDAELRTLDTAIGWFRTELEPSFCFSLVELLKIL